ncbi:MAG TPA: short-chain dehydrogenase/reductase [Mycobacteriales bacterium]|nr:short-chain dehydrogenase/reductase [Mycobacteriales bacterium]
MSRRPADLRGRVVLVTGASRGIGAATARALAARGARLSLVGLEPDRLAALATELGPEHVSFAADVTVTAQVDSAVAGTVAALGGIDAVVANAGVASYGTIRVATPEAFARTVEVNLVGVYRTAYSATPQLIARRGYLLIVASVASFTPLPGAAAYAASKAGVESLAHTLRVELAAAGVAVGSAHPCWIDTDMVRAAEDALPTFRVLRARLPWPANATTSVTDCADVLAGAVARRARRVYVPRPAGLFSVLRPLVTSRAGEAVLRRRIRHQLPALDDEARLASRPARSLEDTP